MARVVPAALLVLALAGAPVLTGCGDDDTGTEQGLATPGATTTAPPPTTAATTVPSTPQPPKTPAPGQEDPASPAPSRPTTTLQAPGATPPPSRTVTTVERPSKPVRCPAAAGFKGGAGGGGAGDFDARELLGLEIAKAKALAKRNGCAVRVVNRDGQELVRTMDYSGGRINVTETKGRIVALNGIG